MLEPECKFLGVRDGVFISFSGPAGAALGVR